MKDRRAIIGARDSDNKILNFAIKYERVSKQRARSSGKVIAGYPNAQFRKAIAWNIQKIESFLGTRISRNIDDSIAKPIGGGSHGLVYQLENGNVLKITLDQTEAANALFIKGVQRRNPKIMHSTAYIKNVAKMWDKDRKIKFSVIEREYIEYQKMLPLEISYGTGLFVDSIVNACDTNNEDDRKQYLALARDGLKCFAQLYPDLYYTMSYTWNKGLPQLDAASNNIGIRVQKVAKHSKSGDIVLFDFGLGNQLRKCWQVIKQDAEGDVMEPTNKLRSFQKRIQTLR